MAVPNKSVIVRSFNEIWEDGYFHDGTSSTTTKPGALVKQVSGGLTIGDKPSALPTYGFSAANDPVVIVIEDNLQGKTVNDDIAVGDYIRVKYLLPGERYLVRAKASEVIAVGDLLEPHTNGTVKLHNTTGAVVDADYVTTLLRAESAVGGADTDRTLVVRVLRV